MQAPFKAAIAINNIGVSLLERGRYADARTHLRSAVAIFSDIFPLETNQTRKLTAQDVDRKLAEAYQSMAKAPPQSSQSQSVSVASVLVLADDDCAPLSSHCDFWGAVTTNTPVAVRIEPSGEIDPVLRDTEVDACIVLNNYALAHRCLAVRCNDPGQVDQRRRIRNGALSLWRLSYSALARRTESQCVDSSRILEVCCINLHNMVGCLIEVDSMEEAAKYAAPLNQTLAYLQQVHGVLVESSAGVAAAA